MRNEYDGRERPPPSVFTNAYLVFPRNNLCSFRPVTHVLDRNGNNVTIATDGKHCIGATLQGRMTSKARFVPSTMVDYYDDSTERLLYCFSSPNVVTHVEVLVLGPVQGFVQRVENDCSRHRAAKLPANVMDE